MADAAPVMADLPDTSDKVGDRCQLLGPTALVVQGLMGIFVIASLVVKRQLEKRKRPWRIWIMDVGKQLVGQAVLHGANLLISAIISIDQSHNPCSAYLLNVLIDTTIGVLIIYVVLKHATWVFVVYLGKEGYESGHYGNPPQVIFWWRQLVPYLIAVLSMKLLVLLPLTLPGISTVLLNLGHAAIEYLSPSVQVIFVMAVFPLCMNVLQFCLIDQVIKAGKPDEADPSALGGPTARDEEDTPSSPLLAASAQPKGYGSDTDSPGPSRRGSALNPFSTSRVSVEVQREARKSLSPVAARGQSPAPGFRI